MLFGLIVLVVLLMGAGFMVIITRTPTPHLAGKSAPAPGPKNQATPLPRRVTNPAFLQERAKGLFWHFKAGAQACPSAQRLDGTRVEAANSVAVPFPDCSCQPCTCQYAPLNDQRKKDRRFQIDRRDGIRFETEKKDRRASEDRRRSNKAWKIGSYN